MCFDSRLIGIHDRCHNSLWNLVSIPLASLRLLRLDTCNGLIESPEAEDALTEGPDNPHPPHKTHPWRPVFTQTRLHHVQGLNKVDYQHQDEPGQVPLVEKVGKRGAEEEDISVWGEGFVSVEC